ncbi:conserved hypothetical protein [Cytophaga hutchinsonii ATCC 33406]|uniref:Small multi-drug export protein n=2 Tax=Cytophaga hutchinsonii TaxID=985 RepID=A0A6N4SNF6_CYTH3|nr:conserved hypothetical protein [Cytophaga hutchinsonii ATCC 33406]SFX05860.1 hypothetical protein SAMN04487930_101349 [Cytophaga hutchinsonii ATCC 33406]
MGIWAYICPMLEKAIQYVTVILVSSAKFGFAPFIGKAFSLSNWEIIILMVIGMMLTVVLLTTLLGDLFYGFLKRTLFKNRKTFSPKTRNIVRVWNKRGLIGVAFLTPVLFSPIGGALIAISFGEHKKKIILYMFLSACFWAPLTVLFMDQLIQFVSSFIDFKQLFK